MEDQGAALGGPDGHLHLLPQQIGRHQRALIRVCPGQALASRLRLIPGEFYPGRLAILEEKQQISAVVAGDAGPDKALALVEAQLGGKVVAQYAGLGVVEVAHTGLIALLLVGKDQQLVPIAALPGEKGTVALLVLLLRAHAQGLGGDFFEIALPGEEYVHRIIGDVLLRIGGFQRMFVDQRSAPGDRILLLHVDEL